MAFVTSSSFLRIIDDYKSKLQPKLVDYSSSIGNVSAGTALSSSSEHRASGTPINEHHAGLSEDPMDMSQPKGQPPTLLSVGEIRVLPDATGLSMLCHRAQCSRILPDSAHISMVSHIVHVSNSFHTSMFDDGVKPEFNLWQHLVDISRLSFTRAIKRKRELEAGSALCDALETLSISKPQCEPLDLSFKKLCLVDSEEACDDSRGMVVKNAYDSPKVVENLAIAPNLHGNCASESAVILSKPHETLPVAFQDENGETSAEISCVSKPMVAVVFPAKTCCPLQAPTVSDGLENDGL